MSPAFAAVKDAGPLVIWGDPEAVSTCLVLFTEAPSPLLVGRHPLVKPSSGGCKPKTWVFESGGCSRLLTGILSR